MKDTELKAKIREIIEDSYKLGDDGWGKKYGEKTVFDKIFEIVKEKEQLAYEYGKHYYDTVEDFRSADFGEKKDSVMD